MNVENWNTSKMSLFNGIDGKILQDILTKDSIVHYKKGSVIVESGAHCRSIGIVLDGVLSLNRYTKTGQSIALMVLHEDDTFGMSMFSMDRSAYTYSVVARTRCTILLIPFSKVEELFVNDPQFTRNFIKELSRINRNFDNYIQILHQKDVRSRLIGYIAMEYELVGKNPFHLSLRYVDIAELIGVAVPSVSRELHRMEADGLLKLGRNKITLLKVELFQI